MVNPEIFLDGKVDSLVCLVLMLGLPGSAAAQEVKSENLVEWWLNLSGNTVADVRSHPGFPDDPDSSAKIDTFEVPQSTKPAELSILNDNYGARVIGYLYPPADGDYTFWITSDNGGEFLLSTDDDPAKVHRCGQNAIFIPLCQFVNLNHFHFPFFLNS